MPGTSRCFSSWFSKWTKALRCVQTPVSINVFCEFPERSGKPNSVIITPALGFRQLREKFSIHLEQMSPTFRAVEGNMKPHGLEN